MATFKYFLEPSARDSHQASYYWLALVTRFAVRNTADHQKLLTLDLTKMSVSKDRARPNPVEELDPLVLTGEIASWNVQSNKNSPQGSATFSLQPMAIVDVKGNKLGYDWRRHILGGDWIMFWAFDNKDDYLRVKAAVTDVAAGRAGRRISASLVTPSKTANGFMDGLKFIGRVQSVRRRRTRNQMTGTPDTSYLMTAVSGKEFASKIYYNPALTGKFGSDNLDYLLSFAKVMSDFVSNPKGAIEPDVAIEALLKACLGLGPSERWRGIDPAALAPGETTPVSLTASPNGRVLVPKTVAALLRGATNSGPDRKFHDILKGLIGRQVYTTSGVARRAMLGDASLATSVAKGFTPELEKMDGFTIPLPTNLNGPIWSIVTSFLNEPVNEMYYTLRVNASGDVMPTVVARQIPLSSWAMHRRRPSTTAFIDLPRWVMSSKMVLNEDLGASEALRTNYTWLQPRDQTTNDAMQASVENTVKYPPMADLADIERNGLNWYSKQLGSHLDTVFDNDNIGRYWTRLLADVAMDQHLKFTGSLTTVFIQEPVAVGDNLQFDGGIYHIEQIAHQGGISSDGKKTASTSFSLTHGISTDSDNEDSGRNIYLIEDNGGNIVGGEPSDRTGDGERVFFGHNQDTSEPKKPYGSKKS